MPAPDPGHGTAWLKATARPATSQGRQNVTITPARRSKHAVLAAGHGTALFKATPRPPRRTPIALERHRQAGEKSPGRRSKWPDHRNRSDLAAINAKGQAVKSP